MISRLLSICFTFLFVSWAARAHPLGWPQTASAAAEKTWGLWSWFWAPDSIVTVVDRDNPVHFISRPASFGRELRHPLLGYVIPLSEFTTPCKNVTASHYESTEDMYNTGCPRLCLTGPHRPSLAEPWIALVQRGDCAFVSKVREAQRLGAKAVVVGGDNPALTGHPDALVAMIDPGSTSDLNVTATYIRFSDYVILSRLIEASDTVHSGLRTVSLLISPDSPAGGWISPVLTFTTILLLPSLLTFLTLLIHRIRMARAARRERAPEDIVRSLPSRVWTGTKWEKYENTVPGQEQPCTAPVPLTGDASSISIGSSDSGTKPRTDNDPVRRDSLGLASPSTSSPLPTHQAEASFSLPTWAEAQTECAICLSDFAVGDRVRVLPCSHIFHMDEVDGWLINNKKLCPICKADVTQPVQNCADSATTASEDGAADRQPNERTPLLGRGG